MRASRVLSAARRSAYRDSTRSLPQWWGLTALLLAASAVGVALGYLGFRDLAASGQADCKGDYDALDTAYRAIGLLFLDGGATPCREGPFLQVGRVLAPGALALTLARAAAALLRDQIAGQRARRCADHVVVAGVGSHGMRLALAYRAAGRTVVAIDRTLTATHQSLRERGVHLVAGDARDPRILRRAALGRAKELLVTCGDDGGDIEVAFAARRVERTAGGELDCLAELNSVALWPRLQAVAITTPPAGVRIEFFNVHDMAARLLLDENSPGRADARDPLDVVILGATPIVEQLVLHLVRSANADGGAPAQVRVTLAGPDAGARVARLYRDHPRLQALAELRAERSEEDAPWDGAVAALGAADPPGTVFVCLADEPQAVTACLALARPAATAGARVVLVVDDERRGLAAVLGQGGALPPGLSVFGSLDRTLRPDLAERGMREAVAQSVHAHYARAVPHAATGGANPSAVPWAQLPPALQRSNRDFADRLASRLPEERVALFPNPLVASGEIPFRFTPDEVERLARNEHAGWCTALLARGWRLGPERDPDRLVHPSLVPWEELSEEQREIDRKLMRAIPAIVATAGLELMRVGDDGGATPTPTLRS